MPFAARAITEQDPALGLLAVDRDMDDLILFFEFDKPRRFGFLRKRVD